MMLQVEVTCGGITPLMFNKVDPATLEKLRTKTKDPKSKTASSRTPREEADPKYYRDPDNNPVLPVEMLFASLVNAGQYVRLDGKRQISTAQKTLLPAFLRFTDPYFPIVDHTTGDPAVWEPDMRWGRNPNGGEMVALCRPRFDRWTFTAKVQIDTSEIDEFVIRNLFDIAGSRIGVGEFRPQRKGIYGQFKVDNWQR